MSLFQRAFHLAHYVNPCGGECLEFGVYQGDTYCYQAHQIVSRYPNSALIGFDSWQGLPEESQGIWAPERHAQGCYTAQKEIVLKKLAGIGVSPNDNRFTFVDGFFSESLTDAVRNKISNLIFVNIDVDIHRSTLELLDFIRPILRPGVVIYWDDWKDPADENHDAWGEHLAWEQWSAINSDVTVETIEINSLNQRIMIVTQVADKKLEPPIPSMSEIRYYAFHLASETISIVSDSNYQIFLKICQYLGKVPVIGSAARKIWSLIK